MGRPCAAGWNYGRIQPMLAAPTQAITFLPTADLAGTARFYGQGLGLRLARDQGVCLIYHLAGSAYLGFCQQGGALPEAGRVVLTLVTDDVDGWCERLRAQGAEVVRAPADNDRFRIYHAYVRDPNGYLLELQRFWEALT